MSNKLPLTGEMDHDERSMKQWMEDQGLEYVVKGPKIKGAKWIPANRRKPYSKRHPDRDLSLARTALSITEAALKTLDCKRLLVGSGLYVADEQHPNGEPTILLRPTGDDDVKGYCITRKTGSQCGFLRAERMLEGLFGAGLPLGKYKLYKAKDGYYARLIKGEGYASNDK